MSEHGGRLVDNGYSILPIIPNSKVPGAYLSGEWRPYSDWTKHCSRTTKSFELDVWSRWLEAGIGAACGRIVAADIDILQDARLASEVEGLARRMLGDTPAVRIGMAPKRLMVYRADTPFAGFKRHPIEILARGQQFVAYGIHPETGQPYYWRDESLLDLDISQLPVVTEAQCRAFCDAAYALLPPALRPHTLGADDGSPHYSSDYLIGTYEAIEDALRHIPNPDLPYDDWVKIGLALKSAIGDAGEGLYARWSAGSAKDVPATTARSWRGYRPTTIGAGSIYYHAEQNGWSCPPHLTMNGAAAWEKDQHPAQGLIDGIVPTVSGTPVENVLVNGAAVLIQTPEPQANIFVPDAFRHLDGVMGEFVHYVLASSIRPQPILACAAAIAAVGVLAGRRYRTPTNLRSNIYVVGMAESGGGKDHPRKCIVEAFYKAGLTRYIGGNRIASGSGLLSALNRQPSILFQLDEFGQFMGMAIDKRRAAKHVAEIWDNLTELSTTAGSVFLGAEYADQKERPRQDIIQPCCCVHATTVPGPFWKALQSGALSDGSFARWLGFQTDDPIPDRIKRPLDIGDVPEQLVAGLQAIVRGADGWEHGNLAEAGGSTDPTPYTVPYDTAAEKALDDLADTITDKQRCHLGTLRSALLARVWEHIVKVALVKAISINPAKPVIDLATVRWAEEIVTYCTEMMMRDADRFVADNEIQANHKRVLDIVRRGGIAGLPHSKLMRSATFVRGRELKEIIAALIEGGSIVKEAVGTVTKPGAIYRVTE